MNNLSFNTEFKVLLPITFMSFLVSCGGGGGDDTPKVVIKPSGGKDVNVTLKSSDTDGAISSQKIALPNNVTTACDSKYVIRSLGIHRSRQLLPALMHAASCKTPEGVHKMFTSLTIKEGKKQSGMIIESELDTATGYLKPTGTTRQFDECFEMNGIAAKSDCSVVGALCRRDGGDSKTQPFTKDMVASIPNSAFRFRK